MRLGILSDTHDELKRTRRAVQLLKDAGATAIAHCGDLATPPIVEACAILPCWFVFGNHDADMVPYLQRAAMDYGAVCLDWGGAFQFSGKRIGIVHGHMTTDLRSVLSLNPDYLLSGHSHEAHDGYLGDLRRINPGALHRAEVFSCAILDPITGELQFLEVQG